MTLSPVSLLMSFVNEKRKKKGPSLTDVSRDSSRYFLS